MNENQDVGFMAQLTTDDDELPTSRRLSPDIAVRLIDSTRDYLQIDLERRFTYHPPQPDQVPRYNELREQGKALALLIVRLTPENREQACAITKLEEAIMWANAAIARHP